MRRESGWGKNRKCPRLHVMSVLTSGADIVRLARHVREVPIGTYLITPSSEQAAWVEFRPQGFRGCEVDNQRSWCRRPKTRMLKRQDSHRSRVSRSSIKRVGLFKQLHVLRYIVATFLQRLWIPFTALGGEEVPTVDVNGTGQTGNWIGHRMNDVITKGLGIFRQQPWHRAASSFPPPPGTRRQKMLSSRPV